MTAGAYVGKLSVSTNYNALQDTSCCEVLKRESLKVIEGILSVLATYAPSRNDWCQGARDGSRPPKLFYTRPRAVHTSQRWTPSLKSSLRSSPRPTRTPTSEMP